MKINEIFVEALKPHKEEFNEKILTETYRAASKHLSKTKSPENCRLRLKNPTYILASGNPGEVVVVVHQKNELIDGGSKLIFKALGIPLFLAKRKWRNDKWRFFGEKLLTLIIGFPKEGIPNQEEVFKKEFQVLSELQDGPFLKVYGTSCFLPVKGRKDPVASIVMERGIGDLQKHVDLLKEDDRLKHCVEVLECVKFMHEKKMAHRDIKTENIVILREPSGEYKLKLIDFGHTTRESESVKTVIGSLPFTPPEVLCAKVVKGNLLLKHDIFSLGVLLLEMMTGDSPGFLFKLEEGADGVEEVEKEREDFWKKDHIVDIIDWQDSFRVDREFAAKVPGFASFDEIKKQKIMLIGETIRLMCHWNPKERPSINEILAIFKKLI